MTHLCSVKVTQTKNSIWADALLVPTGRETINIIPAEGGLPMGKMIAFITIRISASNCSRATPLQPRTKTYGTLPPLGASGGSLLASKPGLFLARAEAKRISGDARVLAPGDHVPTVMRP
jgi:hypothetical protein